MAEVKATKAVTNVTLSLSREEAEMLIEALESLDIEVTTREVDAFADGLCNDIANVLIQPEVA